MTQAAITVFVTLFITLAIIDRAMLPLCIGGVSVNSLAIIGRVRLNTMADQERALLIFYWMLAGLTAAFAAAIIVGRSAFGLMASASPVAIGFDAMMRLSLIVLYHVMGAPASPWPLVMGCFAMLSVVPPPMSALGSPAEPLLFCLAPLLGWLLGHSLDHARRLAYAAEWQKRMGESATDAGAATAAEIEAPLRHSFLRFSFHDDAMERAYAVRCFRSAYTMTQAAFIVFSFLFVALAIIDRAMLPFCIGALSFCLLGIIGRVQLNTMADQERALLIFYWMLAGLNAALNAVLIVGRCVFGLMVISASPVAVVAYGMLRFAVTFIYHLIGMSAAPRLVIISLYAVSAVVHPPMSALGYPAEPLVYCSALLLGWLLGHSVDHARRVAYAAEWQKRAGNRANDAGAATAAEIEAPLRHSFLRFSFHDDAMERAYAVRCFRSTYTLTQVFLTVLTALFAIIVIIDRALLPVSIGGTSICVLVLAGRAWLNSMEDQERAALIFHWSMTAFGSLYAIVLTVGRCAFGLMVSASLAALAANAMLRLAAVYFINIAGVPATARLLVLGCFTLMSVVPPPMSALGSPAEPLLFCSAMLLGELLGHSVDHDRRLAYATEWQERAGNRANDAAGGSAAESEAPAHSFLRFRFRDDAMERAYAVRCFRSAYTMTQAVFTVFATLRIALAIIDRATLPECAGGVPVCVLVIVGRAVLDSMADQERAQLIFHWLAATLVAGNATALAAYRIGLGDQISFSPVAIGFLSLLQLAGIALFHLIGMPSAPRLLIVGSLAMMDAVPPPTSALGYPAEPLLFCLALLLGWLLGHSADHARRLAFAAEWQKRMGGRAGAAGAAKIEAPTHSFLRLSYREDALERAYAVQCFRSTYIKLQAFVMIEWLLFLYLAFFDRDARPFCIGGVSVCTTVFAARAWASSVANQERALLIFYWFLAVLFCTAHVLRFVAWPAFGVVSNLPLVVGFDAVRRLATLLMVHFLGIPAAPRMLITGSYALFSIVAPPISTLGRPTEPLLFCSALLLGALLGHSVDHSYRIAFAAAQHLADEAERITQKYQKHTAQAVASMAG